MAGADLVKKMGLAELGVCQVMTGIFHHVKNLDFVLKIMESHQRVKRVCV